MSFTKNVLMREAERRGHSSRARFVCGKCVNDYALAKVVEDNADRTQCDFCEERRETAFAASLLPVIEHMAECISQDYTHPANELPYETREGGFQGTVLDAWDLLANVHFEVESEDLFEEVVDAFSDQEWCERDYFSLSPFQRLRHGWEDFKQVVKHQRRFTFWSMEGHKSEFDPDDMPVGKMLAVLGDFISETDLVRPVPQRSAIWRVRVHNEDVCLAHDHELSPPPVAEARQANRMSPAGVVMFYGAEDFETALLETVHADRAANKWVTGAIFRAVREMRVLDLVDLPEIPSYFDMAASDRRLALLFLHHFARDLAQPVARDGRQHIEYVPTQAFTEYVRFELKARDDASVDGIRYPSSVNGRSCYVLFCTQAECVAQPEYASGKRWLEFDAGSLRKMEAQAVGRAKGMDSRGGV